MNLTYGSGHTRMNITTLSVYEKYEHIVQFLFSVVDEFQTSNLRASTG